MTYSEVGVVEGCDKREAEAEAFSAVSVFVGDDFEAFDGADNMFAGNAVAGKSAVGAFILFGQWIVFAAFLRHLGSGMDFLQAEIARIRQGFGFRMHSCL